MKKLLLALFFSASVMAMDPGPFNVGYSPDGYYYYLNNPTNYWAICRVTFPNGVWTDFWVGPGQSTQWIPVRSAWYCELR